MQQDLATDHSAKTTTKRFANHDITVLDWPANLHDLRKEAEKYLIHADELKCHKLITCTVCCIDAVIHGKGSPTEG